MAINKLIKFDEASISNRLDGQLSKELMSSVHLDWGLYGYVIHFLLFLLALPSFSGMLLSRAFSSEIHENALEVSFSQWYQTEQALLVLLGRFLCDVTEKWGRLGTLNKVVEHGQHSLKANVFFAMSTSFFLLALLHTWAVVYLSTQHL